MLLVAVHLFRTLCGDRLRLVNNRAVYPHREIRSAGVNDCLNRRVGPEYWGPGLAHAHKPSPFNSNSFYARPAVDGGGIHARDVLWKHLAFTNPPHDGSRCDSGKGFVTL